MTIPTKLPKNLTDYNDLDELSKEKYASFLKKVHTSGTTLAELKQLTDKEFAETIGIKKGKRITAKTKTSLYDNVEKKSFRYKNVYAHRRIIKQLQYTKERKFNTIDRAVKKYEKFGFKGKGLDKQKRELIKTIGSVFDVISEAVNNEYFSNIDSDDYEPDSEIAQRLANEYAKELLAIPKDERAEIEKEFDREILDINSP